MVKIVVFAGSASKGSYNRKLAKIAAAHLEEAGAEVVLVELADYPMPIYNADLETESGLPEPAKKLKELMVGCDGFCIASPEYNSCMTPLLKNTLDWISRQEHKDEPALAAYRGKVAAVLSASPGPLGGRRSMQNLCAMLSNVGTLVLPNSFLLARAFEGFDESDMLVDQRKADQLKGLMRELVRVTGALKQ